MAGQVLSKNSSEKFKHLWFLSWKLLTFRHFKPSRESLGGTALATKPRIKTKVKRQI
jgi:hypothetical protein